MSAGNSNHFAALVRTERRGIALFVTLDDPPTRNCMSQAMVAELTGVISTFAGDAARCVVLRGANGTFCSGGDISRFAADAASEAPASGADPIVVLNRSFGHLLEALDSAPQLIVSVVEGAAFGGGLGLVSASDVVIAHTDARFSLSETTLGLIPAQIAPFIVRRVGVPKARWLALTGARIGGQAAAAHGLVDIVSNTTANLDRAVMEVVNGVARCAPRANAATRTLLAHAMSQPTGKTLDDAASRFADALRDEGREGAAAFLGKRRPAWEPEKDETLAGE